MQDQNNSQESNRIGVGIFIVIVIILLILAGAAGVYYASLKQEKPKDLSDTTVKSFDLMEESKMVHRTVDDVLLMKRENWQLRDTGRRQHKDLLEVSGADVVWTDREVAVGVPVTTEPDDSVPVPLTAELPQPKRPSVMAPARTHAIHLLFIQCPPFPPDADP